MKIVIALDSFKGSCSAQLACESVAEGLKRVVSDLDITLLPVSDGGEGLLDAIEKSPLLTQVESHQFNCQGPYGQQISAKLLMLPDQTAIIETAECCGLELTPIAQRNAEKATSFGLGQAVKVALDLGSQQIIIGLGGSATNDGGAGFAQALGAEFFDHQQQLITHPIAGRDLSTISHIDLKKLDPRLAQVTFFASCDVENPLLGEQGATYVYGRQKGADDASLQRLESGMVHFSSLMHQLTGKNYADAAGAGAAGGLGAGLKWFVGAQLQPGIELVLKLLDAQSYIQQADLVIVGEGRLDSQTVQGKAPVGVAELALHYGVDAIALCGSFTADSKVLYHHGIKAMWSLCNGPMSLDTAMTEGAALLADSAENLMRTLIVGQGISTK